MSVPGLRLRSDSDVKARSVNEGPGGIKIIRVGRQPGESDRSMEMLRRVRRKQPDRHLPARSIASSSSDSGPEAKTQPTQTTTPRYLGTTTNPDGEQVSANEPGP